MLDSSKGMTRIHAMKKLMVGIVIVAAVLALSTLSSFADSEVLQTIKSIDFEPTGSQFMVIGEATITNSRTRVVSYVQRLSLLCTNPEYEKRKTAVANIVGNIDFFQNTLTAILVETEPPVSTVHCALQMLELSTTKSGKGEATFTAENVNLQVIQW